MGKYRKGRGTKYWRGYQYKDSALAHFIAQSSPYAQRMIKADIRRERSVWGRARVGWEKGRTLHQLGGGLVARLNRHKVLEQLAGAAVEHLRLGIEHWDMHGGNILVSRGVLSPIKVKIIDYGMAIPLTAKWLGKRAPGGGPQGTNDYAKVMERVIPELAGHREKEEEKLREFFRRKFLEKVERL